MKNLLQNWASFDILIRQSKNNPQMREWLSGRVSPCQGESRGSESRLPLQKKRWHHSQVVRQGSAKSSSPVQVWVMPPKIPNEQTFGILLISFNYSLFIAKQMSMCYNTTRPKGQADTTHIFYTKLKHKCRNGGIGRRKGSVIPAPANTNPHHAHF